MHVHSVWVGVVWGVNIEKDEVIRETFNALRVKDEIIAEKDVVIGEKEAELQCLRNTSKKSNETAPGMGKQLAAAQKVNVVNSKMFILQRYIGNIAR